MQKKKVRNYGTLITLLIRILLTLYCHFILTHTQRQAVVTVSWSFSLDILHNELGNCLHRKRSV